MLHHSTSFNNYAANCTSTSFTENGVINTYSVSIRHNIDADKLKMYLCRLSLTLHNLEDCRGKEIIRVMLKDIDITFSKVPYKQTRKKFYTQHFRFLRIQIFTPYCQLVSLTDMKIRDKELIDSFIQFNINSL